MLPRVRLASLAALCAALPGCYLWHAGEARPDRPPPDASLPDPIDAGVPVRLDAGARDAGLPPARDGGPPRDGVHWVLVPRDPFLHIPHELGCTVHDGGRVVVNVSIPYFDVCDHGGIVETERADDGTVIVRGWVWRQMHRDPDAACPGITAIATRSLVLEASAGPFRVETADGGSRAMVGVAPPAPDDPPCTGRGAFEAPCLRDCECERGLVCVPEAGDFVECHGGRCGEPCDLQGGSLRALYGQHFDCPSIEECRSRGGLSAPTCGRIEGDGCLDDSIGCGPGTVCPPTGVVSECTWTLALNGSVRHECGSDADCSEGLYCVERRDGFRRCEVPCLSPGMLCPPMHACGLPDWICEWLGE